MRHLYAVGVPSCRLRMVQRKIARLGSVSQVWLYCVAPCFGATLSGGVLKAAVMRHVVAPADSS